MYDLVGATAHVLCVVFYTQTRMQALRVVFTSKLSGNTYIGVANKQFYQVRTGNRSNIAHINKILFNFVIKKKDSVEQ